ncbi:hypothetical protein [Caballeronia hypogeia]|uniref:hypothetical protein n=1 Tax=Caballeronia hypogeia TaxID=1777140 RepID=UPI000ABD330F|nr:hypothetical protein [Caballeronia hypogeia]
MNQAGGGPEREIGEAGFPFLSQSCREQRAIVAKSTTLVGVEYGGEAWGESKKQKPASLA